jgi:iron complex outermembrane recepter protein
MNQLPEPSRAGLRRGIAVALGLSALAVRLAAADAPESADAVKLDTYEVTGSRLAPPDFEGAMPVNVYTSVDLARVPAMTVNNFLRTIPTSFGGGNIDESFVNGGNGQAFIGLRGLTTLLLVNGRRMTTNDLNTVPLAAVERIEILKDGNGAVYGADAVGGVINIITKRKFEGVQFDASYQNVTDKDISRRRFEMVWGNANDRGSLVMGVSYFKQNDLFSRDRDFITETSDRSFGATSSTANPGSFTLTAAQATALGLTGGAGTYRVKNDVTVAANAGSFRRGQYGQGPVETSDRFPFALYTPAVRPAERYNTFVSGDWNLFKGSTAATFYTDITYMRSYSQGGLAPSPAGFSANANAASDFRIPANYYWMQQVFPGTTTDLTSWSYRFLDLGPRLTDTRFDNFAFTTGLKGDLTERISYDVSWFWNRNEQFDIERNGLNRERLRVMLQGGGPFTGARSFNPFTNPFDSGVVSQDPEMLEYLRLEPRTTYENTTEVKHARLQFKAFDVPAGTVEAVAGVESRNERFERTPDLAKQQAAGSGWNSTSLFAQDYTIRSIFAEAVVPLLKEAPLARNLALGVAARRESFSHLPDTPTVVRAYLRNQVNRDLTLRLSYSEGYTAPTPAALDPSESQNFPNLYMPWLGASDQPRDGVLLVGNANLKPTESRSLNLGAVWAPRAIRGLTVTLDAYKIEQDNIIVQDPQIYIDAFHANGGITKNADGTFTKNAAAPFADRIDIDLDGSATGIAGSILSVSPVNTENLAKLTATAIDLEAVYKHEIGAVGQFTWRVNLTHTVDFKIEKIPGILISEYVDKYTPNDGTGPQSAPSWKGFVQADWDRGNLFATAKYNWIASYDEDPDGGQNFTTPLKSFRTLDLTLGYTHPAWGTTFRLGVENAFNTFPSQAESSFADKYDRSMTNILGRMYSISVTQKF